MGHALHQPPRLGVHWWIHMVTNPSSPPMCTEKRPRWWLIDVFVRLLLHNVLFHLRLAQAWLDLAAGIVRLGCGRSWRGQRPDVCVAVEGHDHAYTFSMVCNGQLVLCAQSCVWSCMPVSPVGTRHHHHMVTIPILYTAHVC